MFASVLHLDVQCSLTTSSPTQCWASAPEAALCVQAPTIAENTSKDFLDGCDADLSSQEHEEGDHTPAEESPFSSHDRAAPVPSEKAAGPASSTAPGALPQKAFGSPSERQSSAHAAQV